MMLYYVPIDRPLIGRTAQPPSSLLLKDGLFSACNGPQQEETLNEFDGGGGEKKSATKPKH